MADLLAIISHDRAKPVAANAIEELILSYESLRGLIPYRESAATSWACALVIDRPSPARIGVERHGDGWSAWAGPMASRPIACVPLDRLDGQFALVRLEGDGATLRVATDPLGMKPLFTAQAGQLTYFSTSALVLAKHLRIAPSRAGLEAFLRTGNQFGRETPWEGVTRMLPAQALTFTQGGRELGTYWQPSVDEDVARLRFAACADACVERSTETIAARYAGTHSWLDLTGGFDTRLLALLAQRASLDFMTNTSGDRDSEDVRLAKRIAETAGWQWTQFGLPDDWGDLLPARVDEAVAWGDCHLDAMPLAEVMMGHCQRGESETMLLNGGGGEHFRDYPWGQEMLSAGRSSSVNFERLLAWRVLSPLDLSVFREDPTPMVASNLRTELERRVEPFSSLPNTFQCDLLYAFKATGHFGAYQSAAGAWLHVELPFYLKPVFTTAISALPRHRNYHRLMRKMMQLLDPAIAAVPTETGGPAEPLGIHNLHRFAPYPWRRGRRFAARLRGGLANLGGGGPAVSVGPGPREAANSRLVAQLRDEDRLDPMRMRSGALYEQARFDELLDRAVSTPASVDWTTVGRIVTAELALEAVDAGLD